jgi:hypothetical protein
MTRGVVATSALVLTVTAVWVQRDRPDEPGARERPRPAPDRTFMDEVSFNEKGNEITMIKRRSR